MFVRVCVRARARARVLMFVGLCLCARAAESADSPSADSAVGASEYVCVHACECVWACLCVRESADTPKLSGSLLPYAVVSQSWPA